MTQREGVIKFGTDHTAGPLPPDALAALKPLLVVREELFAAGLLGQDPARYHGLGFGNVSHRVRARPGCAFVVSGVQTSGRAVVGAQDFALVTEFCVAHNKLTSTGHCLPSSESLTHAAVLEAADSINCVLHVHAPVLFHRAAALGLRVTDPDVAYGTPEMAREVRAFVSAAPTKPGVCVMGGHEDGVLAYGDSAASAHEVLKEACARAREAQQRC